MTDPAHPEAADHPGVDPGCESHRSGHGGEDQADRPPLVECIGDDLLDRGDVSDQAARTHRQRQGVAAR